MSNTAIEFENIGKLYQLGRIGTGTLSHDINRWWQTRVLHREDPYLRIGQANVREQKGSSPIVWALRDINFRVEQGEVIGIIGRNGAGKSTLLKLLSRITAPTVGAIRVRGRIASLLEVGTGMHPEMTGRENIYMNGSIMGMTRHEITRKLDQIIAFAGIERYVDTPVKRYSSGMYVRLGFAVAAFLEPEILVVDEVLAVGDAEFQKKAIGAMKDVSTQQGRTVLFVSHNMSAISALCPRCVLLNQGRIAQVGDTADCVAQYLSQSLDSTEGGTILDHIQWSHPCLRVHRIEINGQAQAQSVVPPNQKSFHLLIEGETSEPLRTDPMLRLRDRNEVTYATFAEGKYRGELTTLPAGPFCLERDIELPAFISSGDYVLDLYLFDHSRTYHLKAPRCAQMYVHGGFEGYGKPLRLDREGIIGLRSLK